MSRAGRIARAAVAVLALVAVAAALVALSRGMRGLEAVETALGPTPVTVLRAAEGPPGPAVVIAHGFAGSRQLMEPFAVTLARNGYTAVSFDFLGHGRNPAALTGDVTAEDGATLRLVEELGRVVDFAAGLEGVDGRVALLGHSMASDIVVRHAVADPRIRATVAVSMFSRAVTAERPANLLVIVGEWEEFLTREALDAVALAAGEGVAVRAGETYGRFADGTARRAALADNVEHVGVLYSPDSMAEALDWLDAAFASEAPGGGGGDPAGAPAGDAAGEPRWLEVRGPWILTLIAGIVALGWPLAALLPRLEAPPAGSGLGWRRVLAVAGAAAVATPLLLWPMPTGFLPVLVADYLALHFALYGALTAVGLGLAGGLPRGIGRRPAATLAAAVAVAAYGVLAMGLALDAHVASFMPHGGRVTVILALFAGVLPYMLAEEWLAGGPGAPRGAYAAAKLLFLGSLALAVALNLEKLFFLIIILPVIVLFFAIYGLFARWVGRCTGQPAVAGLANAVAFAWALGVTFPLVGG